jgi:transcriptional regulator GlxA family with amidase domain
MRNIAILIFDDAEVLDFCGPFEVFSVTNELNNYELFNVYTVAERKRMIRAKNGLSVIVSAGISAGIDMCLYLVARLHGEGTAGRTARYMEYSWDNEKRG